MFVILSFERILLVLHGFQSGRNIRIARFNLLCR